MSRWFRFYDDALNDPKVQKLSDQAYRGWVNCMCVASKNDGELSEPIENIAFALRKSLPKTRELLQVLQSGGLLDRTEKGWKPHNWDVRQYKSDVSTPRVKRFRKRHETVTETAPDTEQNRAEQSTTLRVVAAKRKSRSQLPDDFPLQADKDWSLAYWLQKGRTDLASALDEETAKFRDHHAGKLTASADWPGSWRTWTRNTMKFSNGAHNGRIPRKSNHEVFYDAASAVAARIAGRGHEQAGSPEQASILLLPAGTDKTSN